MGDNEVNVQLCILGLLHTVVIVLGEQRLG